MKKDHGKLVKELVKALHEAGYALAVAERETIDSRKRKLYAKAMRQASDAIERTYK